MLPDSVDTEKSKTIVPFELLYIAVDVIICKSIYCLIYTTSFSSTIGDSCYYEML